MKKVCAWLLMVMCLLLSGCSQTPEQLPADSPSRWEGEGIHWKVSAEIPHSPEKEDWYFKVTFTCDSPDHVYDANDQVYFAIGTSVGSHVFTYDKPKGVLEKDEYDSGDAWGLERVTPVSDTEFEVLYEKRLVDGALAEKEQAINIQLPGESIDLHPVES